MRCKNCGSKKVESKSGRTRIGFLIAAAAAIYVGVTEFSEKGLIYSFSAMLIAAFAIWLSLTSRFTRVECYKCGHVFTRYF